MTITIGSSISRRFLTTMLVGGLMLSIMVLWGCSSVAATSAERPSQTEIMQLVPPPQVPPPIDRDEPAVVKIELETTALPGYLRAPLGT